MIAGCSNLSTSVVVNVEIGEESFHVRYCFALDLVVRPDRVVPHERTNALDEGRVSRISREPPARYIGQAPQVGHFEAKGRGIDVADGKRN